jgi:PAS domain S-box-containing protein
MPLLDFLSAAPLASNGIHQGLVGASAPRWVVGERILGHVLFWLASVAIPFAFWRLARRQPLQRRLHPRLVLALAAFAGCTAIGHILAAVTNPVVQNGLAELPLLAAGITSALAAWILTRASETLITDRDRANRSPDGDQCASPINAGALESEARFRHLADALPQIVWIARPDGRLDYYNERWYEYTGFTGEIGGDDSWRPILHPDDQKKCRDTWSRAVETGEPYAIEYRFKDRRTGGYRWHLGRALPVKDENGRVIRWFGTCTDIDDQKRAEEALRDAERRFRALLETVPQLVWTTGPEGTPEYANPQWLDYTGFASTAELTARWWETLHPDDTERIGFLWQRALRVGDLYDVEFRMRRHDGAYRWFKTRGVPIHDAAGKVVRWFGTCTDIDDQMRAEEVLRRSEERFRRLVQNSSDIIAVLDAAGTILYKSPSIEHILGHRPEDRIGKNVFAHVLVHPDDLSAQRAFLNAVLQNPRDTFAAEFRMCHADGSWRQFEAIGQNLLLDPSVAGVVVNYRDITERKRAEERLRDSEARMRAIVDTAVDGIITIDERGIIESVNPAAVRTFGYTDGELVGVNVSVLMPAPYCDDHDRYLAHYREMGIRNVIGNRREVVCKRKDGNQFPVDLGISEVRLGERRIFTGIIRDITDRKHAEEELRESEQRQRRALSAARLAHWEWDVQTQRIDYQDSLALLCGRRADQPFVDVADYLAVVHPDDQATVCAAGTRALEAGVPLEVEYRVIWPNESIHWIAARGATFCAPDGTPLRMVGVNIDITERKDAEAQIRHLNEGLERRVEERTAELARARDEAEAGTRAKSAFLANTSHEIRTPMNGVLGMADLLLETSLDTTQANYVHTIHQSAEALLTIIDDILDLSKIEAGKLTLETSPLMLRAMLEDVARLLSPQAEAKGLQLTVEVDPHLRSRVRGDGVRIRQVLTNLAGNAVKFTEAGQVTLEAGIIAIVGDRVTIRFAVHDTGIGIPIEHQARVFESFTQVEGSTNRRFGGTGLGLTICRSLVHLMGGSIGLDSQLGSGSTFWVELPLELVAGGNLGRGGKQQVVPEAPLETPLHVLLAEDHDVNRRVAAAMIKRLGCTVDVVCDGREALNALETRSYDVVLMDVQMPGLDGLAATIEIRRREAVTGRHVPILALTANAMTGDRDRCLEAGMDGYVTKPIRRKALRDALVRCRSADEKDQHADSAPNDSRPFQPSYLEECCGLDIALIAEVIESFLDGAPGQIVGLEIAIAGGSFTELERKAHRLKGACLTIGAESMAEVCERLVSMARAGDLRNARPTLAALSDRWKHLKTQLTDYRARIAKASTAVPVGAQA